MILLMIWLVLIAAGVSIKESKAISYMQILFIAIMFMINKNNPDRMSYLLFFNNINNGSLSITNGNYITGLIFKTFGALGSYDLAIFFIALICMILIYRTILFFTSNSSFVLAMYLIAPFTIDATQIKNFMAMSVWIFFLRYLYKAMCGKNRYKNIVIYNLGVLISAGIHFSFILTSLYTLIVFFNDRKIIAKSIIVVVLVAVSVYSADAIIGLLTSTDTSFANILDRKLVEYSLNYDLVYANARTKRVVEFFIITGFFLYIMSRGIKGENGNRNNLYNFTLCITLLALILIPLMKYSVEVYRLQRNMLLLYYIAYTKIPIKLAFQEKRKVQLNIGTVFSLITASIYLVFDSIFGNYYQLFLPLFGL